MTTKCKPDPRLTAIRAILQEAIISWGFATTCCNSRFGEPAGFKIWLGKKRLIEIFIYLNRNVVVVSDMAMHSTAKEFTILDNRDLDVSLADPHLVEKIKEFLNDSPWARPADRR